MGCEVCVRERERKRERERARARERERERGHLGSEASVCLFLCA